jgi:hypothetical protein
VKFHGLQPGGQRGRRRSVLRCFCGLYPLRLVRRERILLYKPVKQEVQLAGAGGHGRRKQQHREKELIGFHAYSLEKPVKAGIKRM